MNKNDVFIVARGWLLKVCHEPHNLSNGNPIGNTEEQLKSIVQIAIVYMHIPAP